MKRFGILNRQYIGNCEGFTLFEIIITVLIMAIAIVPMINAYAPGVFSSLSVEETAVFTSQARGTLHRVMAVDFSTLNALVQNSQADPIDLVSLLGSSSEDFSFRGKNYTPNVVITDASGVVGGLLEISVSVDRVNLRVLKAQY